MSLTRQYNKQVIDYIKWMLNQPRKLDLGGGSGPDGGSGAPPGGVRGQLAQIYVCFDETEATTAGSTPPPGNKPSLVQNLNRIRGGWAIGDEAIHERHLYWATSINVGTSGCIESRHVPFYSTSGEIVALNVRDAIEEVYAGAAASWHGYSIILYHADGSAPNQYTADSAGLDSASAAAVQGDVVFLPCVPISGNHTLSPYVSYVGISRQATKLTGQITLAHGVSFENITVTRTGTDSTIKGIINPTSGSSKVVNCEVICVTNGVGDAYAVSIDNESILEVWDSYLHGFSAAGNGYAGYRAFAAGSLYVFGGRAYGSTDEFSE